MGIDYGGLGGWSTTDSMSRLSKYKIDPHICLHVEVGDSLSKPCLCTTLSTI